eukprot:m.480257 g.480257  ORF g.480257 m.480257 type:complete len:175 (+) comp21752_c0_seq1:70-594(+)
MALSGRQRWVFVTVGTTSFDQLIDLVNTRELQQVLRARGFVGIKVQLGRGKARPSSHLSGFWVEWYDFKPSLAQDMGDASLVISHAGAGTVLECLEIQTPLLVVINETLMGNHQLELAEQMHKDGFLLYASCATLVSVVSTADVGSLSKYTAADPSTFANFLDSALGYSTPPVQ